MQRDVVVFPQPLSPTSESVSPRRSSKLTSSTARTCPTSRRRSPRRIGKYFRSPRTSRRSPSAAVGRVEPARSSRPVVDRGHRTGRACPETARSCAGPDAGRGPRPRRAADDAGSSSPPRRAPRRRAGAPARAARTCPGSTPRSAGGRGSRPAGCAGAGSSRRWSEASSGPGPGSTGSSGAGPACTGCWGAWKIASTGPRSTTRPRYMTTTSSHISATTPRLWVIRMIAIPSRACRWRSRSRICACVVTSSAVVGSSAIRTRGPQASAVAIIARCRSPPLSWNAYSSTRRSGLGIPTCRRRSIARSRAPRASRPRWSWIVSIIWFPTVWTGLKEVIGSWKTSPISPPRICRISRLSGSSCARSIASGASGRPRPAGRRRRISPLTIRPGPLDDAEDRARGDALAAAALPDDAERPARVELEARPVHRLDDPLLREEVRAQVPHAEDGGQTLTSCRFSIARNDLFRSQSLTPSVAVGVGGVAQAVAHEVERDDDDDHRDRRRSGATARWRAPGCSAPAGGARPS